MTREEDLLRAVLADPDDDAPRLVLADWLEDRGDADSLARGELIRVQVASAGATAPNSADLPRSDIAEPGAGPHDRHGCGPAVESGCQPCACR